MTEPTVRNDEVAAVLMDAFPEATLNQETAEAIAAGEPVDAGSSEFMQHSGAEEWIKLFIEWAPVVKNVLELTIAGLGLVAATKGKPTDEEIAKRVEERLDEERREQLDRQRLHSVIIAARNIARRRPQAREEA